MPSAALLPDAWYTKPIANPLVRSSGVFFQTAAAMFAVPLVRVAVAPPLGSVVFTPVKFEKPLRVRVVVAGDQGVA
jgi:hypothetical protein